MPEGWEGVWKRLSFADACAARQVCRAWSEDAALGQRVAAHHRWWSAVAAAPLGQCSPERSLSAMLSAVAGLAAAASLGEFSAPLALLGEGPMSTVELRRHGATGVFVAVKAYAKKSLVKFGKVEEAVAERDAMRELRQHPLVVKLLSCFQNPDCLFLVLEFCPHGDLVDVVRRAPGQRLPSSEAIVLVRQLIEVLQFVHQRGLVHRDVKLENVLVGGDGSIRLTDFATVHRVGTVCKTPFAGSPQYIAPEIINGGQPTVKVDVFGAGCVAFYLLLSAHAFLRDTDFLTWQAILNDPVPLPISEPVDANEAALRAFIVAATQKDPSERHFFAIKNV